MKPKAPVETLVFKVTPHRAPEVFRVIELRAAQKLRELHEAIAEEFAISEPGAYRFFLKDVPWDRENEYGPEGRGKQAVLGKFGLAAGSHFLHMVPGALEQWH